MLSASDTGRTLLLDPTLWEDRGNGATVAALPRTLSSSGLSKRKDFEKLPEMGNERLGEATEPSPDSSQGNTLPSDVVMQQLDRILQSRTFIQSEKLSRFLRFVVEHVLHGNPDCLKEYLVGVEVYDRKPPYDPSQDSIVRTEARRLRNKLKEYYEAEGKDDPLFIYLRPGSYVPAFQSSKNLAGSQSSIAADGTPPPETLSIVTAIMPFTDISGTADSARYARGIPDELAYRLTRKDHCTVIAAFPMAKLPLETLDIASAMRRVGAQIAFEGSTRIEGTTLRITARIVDAVGLPLWVVRLNVELGTKTFFEIEESIGNALSEGFDAVQTNRAALSRQSVP